MTVEQIEMQARAVAQKYEIAAEIRRKLDNAVQELQEYLRDEDIVESILEIVGADE